MKRFLLLLKACIKLRLHLHENRLSKLSHSDPKFSYILGRIDSLDFVLDLINSIEND